MHVINHRGQKSPRARLGQAGYTLAELLVAASIGLVALGVAGSFQRFQLHTLMDQATQLNVQSTARSVADIFAREVRRACGISEAKRHSIRFQADLDLDGAIGGGDENVRYHYNTSTGKITRKTANSAAVTLVNDLDIYGSKLRYFDADGNEMVPSPDLSAAQRDAIRRVRIELSVADDSVTSSPDAKLQAEVSTDVELRNRFFVGDVQNPILNCTLPTPTA